MRKPLAVLTTAATALGLALLGSGPAAAATAPTVDRAWIAKDTNRVGILDAGDVLKVRFTTPIVITDTTSMGVDVRGRNGVGMRLENEVSPYGMSASVVRDKVLVMRVNLIPEEYGVQPLTYALRLTDVHGDGKVFYNVSGTNGVPVEVGSKDALIN